MNVDVPAYFEQRHHESGVARPGDIRTPYQRDRARIVHSAAFRRLQGKTQVMGVGEGDFHRTRLTHSIECAQIGNGLLDHLKQRTNIPEILVPWMPSRDLIEAACFAHDLGHPPFGHGGETSLHQQMFKYGGGGFEGNGQTLRIVTRLEKYKRKGLGIDPTRRLILAILKYPAAYSSFDSSKYARKPPKCFFDEEKIVVEWALAGFSSNDQARLQERDHGSDKPKHRTFDCFLMELADDVAYGIHDIEDIVARKLAGRDMIESQIREAFKTVGGSITVGRTTMTPDTVNEGLFGDSFARKQMISELVNLFVTNVEVFENAGFDHALFAYRADLPQHLRTLLSIMKDMALHLVVGKAQVQQLERRGQRIVGELFETLKADPYSLVPEGSWADGDESASDIRRVCDYVAGMTDSYAEKVYQRLFIPGFGSSADEL